MDRIMHWIIRRYYHLHVRLLPTLFTIIKHSESVKRWRQAGALVGWWEDGLYTVGSATPVHFQSMQG